MKNNESNNTEKLIDLHTHTNYSDGDLSPNDLIKLANKHNINVLAITDHNTIEGLLAVDRNNPIIKNGELKLISGIELYTNFSNGKMHILGYDININNEFLNHKVEDLRDDSVNSVLSIMEQIKRDYGIVFGYEDIRDMINANRNLGRTDIARLCVKYGHASSIRDAFNKYLINAHNKTKRFVKRPCFEECFDIIKKSEGIPVLAHPRLLRLKEKELLILMREMVDKGLMGIEVYHSSHTKEDIELYSRIAKEFDLLVSGGSDYHGKTVKPDIEIGTGQDNLKIKSLSILEKIH